MYTQTYVTAVDSTGSDPNFSSPSSSSSSNPNPNSNSVSVEIMTYDLIVPETNSPDHQHTVSQVIRSPRIRRFKIPASCFTSPDTAFLETFLRPIHIDHEEALWSDDLTWSSHEPLGNMAGRLLETGNRIVRVKRPRRQPLRMAVMVAKLVVVESSEFGEYAIARRSEEEVRLLDSIRAATEAADRNAILVPLEMVRYRGDAVECAICLDEVKIGSRVPLIQCCHMFHGKCLCKWRNKNTNSNTCPVCRAILR